MVSRKCLDRDMTLHAWSKLDSKDKAKGPIGTFSSRVRTKTVLYVTPSDPANGCRCFVDVFADSVFADR